MYRSISCRAGADTIPNTGADRSVTSFRSSMRSCTVPLAIGPEPTALISISDAQCRLSPARTLRIASFDLHHGEHWCFFGGNGAGKTVLASLLLGHLRQGRSRVIWQEG